MKLSVALLSDKDSPEELFAGESTIDTDSDEFVQISSGILNIPGEGQISVGAAITFNNQGCSVIIEQNEENLLSLAFGINYPPSVQLKLSNGSYLYVSITAEHKRK